MPANVSPAPDHDTSSSEESRHAAEPHAAPPTDEAVRARVGPWASDGLADLDDFEIDTTFVVRAAAGSGKTTALVARMVALVRCGVDVRSLAAITFTRKAAGEMKERFYRELQAARSALADGPADELALVDRALRDVQHCFIGTVHAFCIRLLREHPLAVSLPPDFVTGLADREERTLRSEALEGYLQMVHDQQPGELRALEDMGVDLGRLASFFDTLCTYPDLQPYTDGPEQAPDMTAAVDEAIYLLERCLEQDRNSDQKDRDATMVALDRAEGMLRHRSFQTAAEQAAFLACFDKVVKDGKADVTLNRWADKDFARSLRDEELPDLVAQVIRPELQQWDALVHRRLVELLHPAVAHYRRMRRDRGTLSHHDPLYLTRELLRDHPDIRARIQERYARILVDEFQDTDPLQGQILFYLAGSDPTETDWRRCTPRPGSLFIVGDDKQSIYRFRRADKDLFDEVARLVVRAGGEVVELNRNFRSLAALCGWCNDAFGALFCRPELEDLQATYVPFQATRPAGADAHGLRRIETGKVRRNDAADIARQDAEQIARFIRAAIEGTCDHLIGQADDEGSVFCGTARYSDFLILTRNKSRLKIYTDELARQGIPYTITGSEDLGASVELQALVQLLRCALRPDDPVACVAYLRGGLCGFSDEDLLAYHRAGGRFDEMHKPPVDEVLARLAEPLAQRYRAALDRVRKARAHLVTTRPSLAIADLARASGLLAGAAHPPANETGSGSLRAGQMLRALHHVRELADKGMDWAEIVEELQRIVDGDEKIDGMTLESGTEGAVRVMNVHQAKGLEAPVVFLADPYSSHAGSRRPRHHVHREGDELVAPVVEGEDPYTVTTHAPLGWHDDSQQAFRAEEERHETAEELRLLYVAATRAKNMLVISTYPSKKNKGYWSELYAHLDRQDVPRLEIPDEMPSPGRLHDAPAPDLEAAASDRRRLLAAVNRASYEEASFTGEKDATDLSHSAFSTEGYGKKLGVAFHALAEFLIRAGDRPLQELPIDALLAQKDVELTAENSERLARMAQGLLASELWQHITGADVRHAEYPLVTVRAPQITRGVVDLLYRNSDGWHIIDFKTDCIAEAEALARLPSDHAYLRQVRSYADAWEELTGETVVRAGLWFADVNLFCEVARG